MNKMQDHQQSSTRISFGRSPVKDRSNLPQSPDSVASTVTGSPPTRSRTADARRRARTVPDLNSNNAVTDAVASTATRVKTRKHTVASRPENLDAVIKEERSPPSARARPDQGAKTARSPSKPATASALSPESARGPRRMTVKLSDKPRKPLSTATPAAAAAVAISPPASPPLLPSPVAPPSITYASDVPKLQVLSMPSDVTTPIQTSRQQPQQQQPTPQLALQTSSPQQSPQLQPPSARRMLEHPQATENCVRMMREACDQGNTAVAWEAQQRLQEVAGSLPSRRSIRSSAAAYRSQIFCSVALAALPARGARDAATAEFFNRLRDTGMLCQLCNALWRGELARDSTPGRAVLSLLRTASTIDACTTALQEVFKYNPAGLLRCCRETLADPFSPEDALRHASELVLTLADDTQCRRSVRNEDPILVALVEATLRPKTGSEFSLVLPQHDESPLLFSDGVKAQPTLSPVERQLELERLRRRSSASSAPRAVLDEFEEGLAAFVKDQDAIQNTLCTGAAVERILEMLELAVAGQRLESFSSAGADAVLLQLMEKATKEDPLILAKCLNALAKACAADSCYRQRIMKEILPRFTPSHTAGCKETLNAHVALLCTSVVKRRLHGGWGVAEDDDGRCIATLNHQLSELEAAAEKLQAVPTVHTAAFLRAVIANPAGGLTLVKAHQQLQAISTAEVLDIRENTVVERLFSFVVETLGLYARTPENADARQLEEQKHGNLALRLLCAVPANEAAMLKADVHQLLLDGIRSHTTLVAVQEFVLAAEALCTVMPSVATAMADHPDGPGVAAQSIVRVRTALGNRPMPELEDILAPRLHVIRLMARNRQVFAQTPIADYLLQLLDDCDEYYFGDIRFATDETLDMALNKNRRSTLSGVGRAFTRRIGPRDSVSGSPDVKVHYDHPSEATLMPWTKTENAMLLALHVPLMETLRRVFCNNFAPALIDRHMPQRLLGLVIQADTNPAVLHHVLFIIGALCADPKIRKLFVQLNGAERVLDLLRRAYPQENTKWVTEVVCNGAMALASVVVGDDEACKRFNSYGGIATAVAMLRARAKFTDPHGVNGASSLICNLSFRNESARLLLGNAGACDALVEALMLYRRGGETTARSLSMAAVFRAIGNLALLGANVEKFMASDVPAAYAAFLEEADGRLDDATLESCFRTLAILVLEVGTHQKFHCATMPVLTLLRKCVGNNTQVYRWAFECIGQLCRYPRSAEIFVREAGAETILSVLPFLAYDRDLMSAALFALGIQTSEPRTVPQLVETGVIGFAQRFVTTYLTDCRNFISKGGEFSAGPVVTTLSPSYLEPEPSMTHIHSVADTNPPTEETTQMPSTVLAVTAMRVLRRVLVGEADCATYVRNGFFAEILETYRLSWPRPIVASECLHLIFCVLTQLGSDTPQSCRTNGRFVGVVSDATLDSLTVGSVASLRTSYTRPLESSNILTSAVRKAAIKLGGKADDSTRGSPALRAKHVPGYGVNDLPRGRKPFGIRAWQKAKMTAGDAEMLIETTRKVLADNRNSRDLRLFRLGIGMLCYWICEKMGFAAFYRTMATHRSAHALVLTLSPSSISQTSSVTEPVAPPAMSHGKLKFSSLFRSRPDMPGDANFGAKRPQDDTAVITLLLHVFETFNHDEALMESAELLLAHMVLCITDESEANVVADRAFYNSARQLILPNDEVPYLAQEVMSLYRIFLQKGWQGPCDSMRDGYGLLDYEFPIELSGWGDDPYPEVLPTDRMELLTLDMASKPEKRAIHQST